MKKYFVIILILLFAFLPAFAQIEDETVQQPQYAPQSQYESPQPAQKGTITGIVVCPNEKDESKLDPIPSVQIFIENSSYSAITRGDGTFSLLSLPYGDYKITAKKDGFYSDEKVVSLSAPFISVTMTIASTKEKTVKTKPGKDVTGGKTPSGMVFVAFASPASQKTQQAVASRVGALDDVLSMDPMQIEAAIAAGTDPRSIGTGFIPKYPHPYDPLVPQTTYQNSIMLFNTKTPGKTTYINLQSQIYWMAYNPENKLLYVSSQSQMVLIYDPGKNEMIGALDVGGQVTDMCLNNDASQLYIAVMAKQPCILILDCYKNKFIKKHVVPKRPAAVAVSNNGNTFYFSMGSSSSGIVYAINASSGGKTGEVKVGNNPNGLCIRPDGKELYVSNLNGASVSVIDTAALSVKATVSVGIEPFKMVCSKDNKKIYVTCRKSNRIDVIDTDTHAVTKTIKTGDCPTGIAINGDGSRIYVTNNESRTISVIDTKNDTVVQTTVAQPRSQPWGIAVK